MFVTILLLAQLVLPGPPSGPIQPQGMICLGECAGPVVWGPAERGRLVVACDMRSDTCSDGRQITTTRATPVPCEVAPDVWEMVPADTGCYSVRGLESWAQNTSYLSYGAELDRSPWQAVEGATVQSLPTGGYRVTGISEGSRIFQLIPPGAGTWTFACVADTGASIEARLQIYQTGGSGGSICNLASVPGFQTHSCTTTITGTPTSLGVHLRTGTGHVDVAGCWLTRTDTPGRPCWGGEAPVTCAADQHTISPEGWPTEEGEVCIEFTLGQEIDGRRLFDSRPGNNLGMLAYVRADGRISIQTNGVAASFSAEKEWEVGRQYQVCIRRSDGMVRVAKDGLEMSGTREFPEIVWGSAANLGADSAFRNQLNGAISSLRIRGVR